MTAHLQWRERLDDFIHGQNTTAQALTVDEAGSVRQCELGQWIDANARRGDPCFERLLSTHLAFHRIAGKIVEDYHFGHRSLARRALRSADFRLASRDVVTALVACFRSLRQSGPA